MRTLIALLALTSSAFASPKYITDGTAKRAVRAAVTAKYGPGQRLKVALFGAGRIRTYSAYAQGELCSYVSGRIDMKKPAQGARLRSMTLHPM